MVYYKSLEQKRYNSFYGDEEVQEKFSEACKICLKLNNIELVFDDEKGVDKPFQNFCEYGGSCCLPKDRAKILLYQQMIDRLDALIKKSS